mmetsp:Transcript_12217/g.20256  ORF Transcript_12217/g.20256 Transcript_12217/m.20256 type:complete len:204 (+) Transcript_12217:90-701(+)
MGAPSTVEGRTPRSWQCVRSSITQNMQICAFTSRSDHSGDTADLGGDAVEEEVVEKCVSMRMPSTCSAYCTSKLLRNPSSVAGHVATLAVPAPAAAAPAAAAEEEAEELVSAVEGGEAASTTSSLKKILVSSSSSSSSSGSAGRPFSLLCDVVVVVVVGSVRVGRSRRLRRAATTTGWLQRDEETEDGEGDASTPSSCREVSI